MNTYFTMHGITKNNKDTTFFDKNLKEVGYDASKTPPSEIPSDIDIATGSMDLPIIYKGKCQAQYAGKTMAEMPKEQQISRIICADQLRCLETAEIIADEYAKRGIGLSVYRDPALNARNYGNIEGMDTEKLSKFYKAKTNTLREKIHLWKTAILYKILPTAINAESKKAFEKRIYAFFDENRDNLDNTLIVAGSDVYKYLAHHNAGMGKPNKMQRGEISVFSAKHISEKDPNKKSLLSNILSR